MIFFLSLSICWPFKFFTTVKPSSLYNRTSFWLMSFVRYDNINIPTSLHTSAPSRQPIKNQELPRNCRQKDNCLMQGKCRMKSLLYKCLASTPTKPKRAYKGISEEERKKLYYNHMTSFQNKRYKNETSLSSLENQEGNQTNTNINMVSCKNSPTLFKYYEEIHTLPS